MTNNIDINEPAASNPIGTNDNSIVPTQIPIIDNGNPIVPNPIEQPISNDGQGAAAVPPREVKLSSEVKPPSVASSINDAKALLANQMMKFNGKNFIQFKVMMSHAFAAGRLKGIVDGTISKVSGEYEQLNALALLIILKKL